MKTNSGAGRFFRLPLPVQLLLVTQMLFNVGFYLVVPFLAVHMTESIAASGAMIGFVLGLRTFSQQGLFFLGGGLADRLGIRPVLLTGIAIRVVGFIVTGTSDTTAQLMLGVVLIGFAAALFSPAAEAALAVSGKNSEAHGGTSRTELFALDAVFSRTGALIGPVLGTLLIGVGFDVTCWVAAGIFTFLFFSHLLLIPAVQTDEQSPMLAGWATVLRNKAFLVFALAYSSYLVAYNSQYLALPIEVLRATGSQDALGWAFVYSSVIILGLQMPITTATARNTSARNLGLGFGLVALGFLVQAIAAPLEPWSGLWALAPAFVMLSLLHIGQMISVPVARDLVGRLAGERNLGAYFGFLNSFGGLAVLLSSMILGMLLDAAETPQAAASLPWLLLSGLSVASAVVLILVCRKVDAK